MSCLAQYILLFHAEVMVDKAKLQDAESRAVEMEQRVSVTPTTLYTSKSKYVDIRIS